MRRQRGRRSRCAGLYLCPQPAPDRVRTAAEIIAALPDEIEKIGVFVNESPERVAEIAEQVGLTGVQLHGDEPADQFATYRRVLGSRKIIKTLQARELLADRAISVLQGYLDAPGTLDAILLDSGVPEQPRWNRHSVRLGSCAAARVKKIKAVLPVIIAGGLTAENVGQAIRLFEPWGVDVVSGVERETGKKDEAKLRSFVAAARQTESAMKAG